MLRALLLRRLGDRVRAGGGVRLGRGVVFDVARGGSVAIGPRAVIGDRARFHVAAGASVVVGAHARLGERCVVAAHERIAIGPRCVLGREAVLLDFDHVFDDPDAPIREQGLVTAPVVLFERAEVGAAAVVQRGVTVGTGARIGVRAVVTADVPAAADVEGVPARRAGTPPPPVPAGRRLVRRG